MALQLLGDLPQGVFEISIAGLTHAIERGSLSATRGRAICKAIQHNAAITQLHRKEAARNERFWRVAPQQQIVELINSGVVSSALMCEHAAMHVVDRNLDSAVAALDDHGLLAPAGEVGIQRLQALYNRTLVFGQPQLGRSARVLYSRYRAINPIANDHSCWSAFVYFSVTGDTSTVLLLLADARVDPAVHNHAALRAASGYGHVGVVQALLADSRVNPRAAGNGANVAAGNVDGVNATDHVSVRRE